MIQMKSLALRPALVLLVSSAAATAQETVSPSSPADDGSIPILALIEQVAEDMDREFIIDPRLQGIRGATTNEEADYESLLGVLRINGFIAVETADQILIMPVQDARSQPSRVLLEDDSRVSDHEIVTRIIEVPGGVATTLVPMLRPMMDQSAMLGAAPNANKLLIVDRYDNVRRITAIVEEFVDGIDD